MVRNNCCSRGYVVLCGSMLLHLTFGNGYTFGNMVPYIRSYLHVSGSNTNINISDLMWIPTIAVIGQGLFMNIGGILNRCFDPQVSMCIGSIMSSAGVALSYFTIKHSVPLFAFTYGFMYGVGVGIAYMAPITVCLTWFPDNRALITGLIVGSLGFGGFVISPIQTEYINPDNTNPNKYGIFADLQLINRVPNTFLLLAAIIVVIQLIGYLLILFGNKRKNEETTAGNAMQLTSRNIKNVAKSTPEMCASFTPKQMLCHHQFYALWVTFLFNIQVISLASAMYKAYGQMFIKDDKYLALVGAVASLCNAGGRVLWGLAMDKSNYKVCMLCVTAGCTVLLGTLPLTPYGGKIMYGFWISGVFLFFSGSFTLFPAITTEKFGFKYAAVNFGLVFTNVAIGALLAVIITQSFESAIGLNGLFVLCGGCSTIGFFITLLLF